MQYWLYETCKGSAVVAVAADVVVDVAVVVLVVVVVVAVVAITRLQAPLQTLPRGLQAPAPHQALPPLCLGCKAHGSARLHSSGISGSGVHGPRARETHRVCLVPRNLRASQQHCPRPLLQARPWSCQAAMQIPRHHPEGPRYRRQCGAAGVFLFLPRALTAASEKVGSSPVRNTVRMKSGSYNRVKREGGMYPHAMQVPCEGPTSVYVLLLVPEIPCKGTAPLAVSQMPPNIASSSKIPKRPNATLGLDDQNACRKHQCLHRFVACKQKETCCRDGQKRGWQKLSGPCSNRNPSALKPSSSLSRACCRSQSAMLLHNSLAGRWVQCRSHHCFSVAMITQQ